MGDQETKTGLAAYRVLTPKNPHRDTYITFKPTAEVAKMLPKEHDCVDRVDHHGHTVRITDRPGTTGLFFIAPDGFTVPADWAMVSDGYGLDKADRAAVLKAGFVAHECDPAELADLLAAGIDQPGNPDPDDPDETAENLADPPADDPGDTEATEDSKPPKLKRGGGR